MNKGEKKLRLVVSHAFGSSCSTNLKNTVGISFSDGAQNLIYPVGKYIGIKAQDRQDMSFVKMTENIEQVQNMCISPNKKLVAISEKYYKSHASSKNPKYAMQETVRPTLCVYDIKHVTGMKFFNADRKYYQFQVDNPDDFKLTQMQFSEDSRFIFVQTSENKVYFIDTTQKQLTKLAQGDLYRQATKLSFNPRDQHVVYASGENFFVQFNIKENQFVKQENTFLQRFQDQNYINHCWIDSQRVALINDNQDMRILDIKQSICREYKNLFQLNLNQVKGRKRQEFNVTSMISFSRGLILGSQNGHFSIWIKNDENKDNIPEDQFFDMIHLMTFNSERKNPVIGLDQLNDEVLAVAFGNSDIATLELQKYMPQIGEPIQQFKELRRKIKKKIYFEYVYDGFHQGPITHLDVCVQRPLIVTVCREDQTIRLWNYRKYRCELARRFNIKVEKDDKFEENMETEAEKQKNLEQKFPLISAAIHPNGYMIAAGFIDKLRIFHVLNNDLRVYKEISVKGVSVIKYSNGGQYLALSYATRPQASHHQTIILNSNTLELVRTLKTHSKKVTEIIWEKDDSAVVTCCEDGNIFKYTDYLTCSDKTEFIYPAKLNSVVFNEKTETYVAVGYDEHKQKGIYFDSSLKEPESKIHQDYLETPHNGPYVANTLAYVRAYHNYTGILAGNQDGYLTTYSHVFSPIYQDRIAAHLKGVSRIVISPDGRYAISTGLDGNIFVFDIQEFNEEGQLQQIKDSEKDEKNINPRALAVDLDLADVVLVKKDEIDKYLAEQKKLQNDFEDLGNKMEYQTQEEKKEMETRIAEVKEKCQLEISQAHKRYQELQHQKTTIEKESANLRKGMENNHLKAVEELENLYEKKLAYENEKYFKLKNQLTAERKKFQQQLKEIQGRHDSAVNELKSEFNDNFHKAENMYETTKATAKELNQHYQEKLDQQEEEHEMEIREVNDKHAIYTAEQNDKIADLLSKNEMFKREEKTTQENMNKMKIKMKETEENKEMLIQALSDANNQIEILKQDKKNYEEQLVKIEKKIHEYKYKINDLQKQKHVLSFRATEMRKSLEPKEAKVDKLKEELFKLEGEFEQMLKNNQKQKEEQDKNKNQIETLQKSLKNQCSQTVQKENLLNKIIMQIHDCVKETDIKQWNQVMQQLYDQYVINANIKKSNHDQQGVDEMSRHIKLLENRIKQMNNSSMKIINRREQDVHKKLKENAELIFDLNELRKQKREEFKQNQDQLDRIKEKNDLDRKKLEDELEHYKKRAYNNTGSRMNPNMMSKTQQNFETRNQQRPQSMRQGAKKAGKVVFGSLFDSKTLGQFDRAKISDLLSQRELDQEKIRQTEIILKNVRQKIRQHQQQFNCQDHLFDEELHYLQEQEAFSGRQTLNNNSRPGTGFQQSRF